MTTVGSKFYNNKSLIAAVVNISLHCFFFKLNLVLPLHSSKQFSVICSIHPVVLINVNSESQSFLVS